MDIHVQLAGVKLGPYSERQVRDFLSEGLLSLKDPACLTGSEDWGPVEAILDKLPVKNAAPVVTEPRLPESAVPPLVIEEKLPPLTESEPVEEEKELVQAEAVNEPKSAIGSEPPAAPKAPTVSKNEPTPLSMPMVVKSLAKKNNPSGKTAPGPVALAPLNTAAVKQPTSPTTPLKVFSRKTEPEAKPRNKPIFVASFQTEPLPAAARPRPVEEAPPAVSQAKLPEKPALPAVSIPVSTPATPEPAPVKKPEPEAAKKLPTAPLPPVDALPPLPGKPVVTPTNAAPDEPISLVQYTDKYVRPLTAALSPAAVAARAVMETPKQVKLVAEAPDKKASSDPKKPVAPPQVHKRGFLPWILVGVGLTIMLFLCLLAFWYFRPTP